jgi:hypothetical protein
MIDELELVRNFIDATVGPEPNVELARQRLVAAIEIENCGVSTGWAPLPRPRRRATRRTRLAISSLAVVGVAAALVALLAGAPPTPHLAPRVAAKPFPSHLSVGGQLRLLADRAGEQPIPHLQPGQALATQADLSVAASVNNGAAQATIDLSVHKLSAATGETCVTLAAQPAQFSSPAAQAAWLDLGLLVTPKPSTATQCLQAGSGGTPPDAITGAGHVIDVSSLPTQSDNLTRELETGTTGIPALDQLTADEAAPNRGFQRAAMLLIGPIVGATPQFNASLFQAIAMLPGVTALGPTATHNGQMGQGFASGPGTGQSAIVVDPSTARLLEVQALDDSGSLASIATNYLGGGLMTVNQYSAQLLWLDPIGPPSVVSTSNLPAGSPVYVFATFKGGLPYMDANQRIHDLALPYFKYFTSISSGTTNPEDPTAPYVFQWSFARPGPIVDQFIQTLRASGFFASVNEV